MIVRKEIGSKKQEEIAEVRLLKNWKLKSKFRFTLKNPPIEVQKKFLMNKTLEHTYRVETAKKVYSQISFSMMTIE